MYTFRKKTEAEWRTERLRASAPPDGAEFARTRLRLELDEAQTTVLESTARRGILNCSRQWGKSTVAAAKAVHRAYTRPKSLVLVASPSNRQSSEMLRKAAEMLGQLGIRRKGDGDNARSLLLPNESRIVGLPGREGTVRGFSAVSLLLVDEAARVEDNLYYALKAMLAVGDGDCWMMSTPWGKRGFFYEAWTRAAKDCFKVSVPATECARISKRHLEEQQTVMGPRRRGIIWRCLRIWGIFGGGRGRGEWKFRECGPRYRPHSRDAERLFGLGSSGRARKSTVGRDWAESDCKRRLGLWAGGRHWRVTSAFGLGQESYPRLCSRRGAPFGHNGSGGRFGNHRSGSRRHRQKPRV
jgi:hypothetical protein